MEKQKKIPVLRFPDFADDWQLKKIGTLTERVTNPVDVQEDKLYSQIGIRSHGKGIFYKEAVTGKSLGNKRVFWVKENTFIVNIVFAWEQAVAKTTEKETGMIASHRFPMYSPVETQSDLDYLLQFFLTRKGKSLLELASPGGAGRNKTLGQKEFENLKFLVPNVAEQIKIASFITAIENKINQLELKKSLLEQYKKGVMQRLFLQELRFKDENGEEFPKWEKKKLGEVAEFYKGKGLPKNEIIENGKYECIHYGELFTKYHEKIGNIISRTDVFNNSFLSIANDVLMPTSDITPSGLATASCVNKDGVILGGDVLVIRQQAKILDGLFFAYYVFQHKEKVMKLVSGSTVYHLYGSDMKKLEVDIPSLPEQTKIAIFLSALDKKINQIENQIQQTGQYKKGLLQNMFC